MPLATASGSRQHTAPSGGVRDIAPTVPTSARLAWQQRGLLVVVTLLVMAPFLGKPLHIDDPLFVWTAEHIQSDPWDFYGFEVNWFGFASPMSDMTKNPPLSSYYLAAAALVLGFSEIGLHLAQLLPTIAAVLGTYELARLLCARPLLAALVSLSTPVFVVSATTLMCDMPLVALWCWTLVCWHRGLLERRESLLLAGAVLATLAALTKYFGMCLIPLLVLDTIAVRRRPIWGLFWLLIPLAVLFAFQRASASLYGYGLISDATAYATNVNEAKGAPRNLEGIFLLLVFLGGCVVSVLFFSHRLLSRWTIGVGSLFTVVLGLIALYRGWTNVRQEATSLRYAEDWVLLAHVIVFLAAGLTVVALIAADLSTRRWHESLLLASWIGGTLLFAGFVNWTVNGRSILPLVPAVGILLARQLDRREGIPQCRPWTGELGTWDLPPIVLGTVLAMAVAAGDYAHAASARQAADLLARSYRPTSNKFTFVGHWGFQYYIQKHGGVPLDLSNTNYQQGDVIIVPRSNTNNYSMPSKVATTTELVEIEIPLPIATHWSRANAGFYGTIFGRLPWKFGSMSTDQYLVQVVHRPFQLNQPRPALH